MVRRAVADHQMRSATADAPALSASAPGLDHLRVVGQAQIIVGAEGQQLAAIHLHQWPLRAAQKGALTIQIGSTALGQASGKIETHGFTVKRSVQRSPATVTAHRLGAGAILAPAKDQTAAAS